VIPVAKHPFPGYPAFLDAAAAEIGHPEVAAPARRIAALSALANLCGQAADAEAEHVPGILDEAGRFRDQLHAAWLAAEAMIADIRAGRGLDAAAPARADLPDTRPGKARRAASPSTPRDRSAP
jgi:hypothetical protein